VVIFSKGSHLVVNFSKGHTWWSTSSQRTTPGGHLLHKGPHLLVIFSTADHTLVVIFSKGPHPVVIFSKGAPLVVIFSKGPPPVVIFSKANHTYTWANQQI
jgi:hypothetical protein